jgi:Acetyltransferase (GNAT) domain
MKLNYETCLVGKRCILVPYRPQHVAQYHEWMQNASLLEATGSEPLTLPQEYEMQESWRLDENKCTFIVLARDLLSTKIPSNTDDSHNDDDNASFIVNNLRAMVGDVNLFLSEQEDDEATDGDKYDIKNDEVESSPAQQLSPLHKKMMQQAELDIMIAEPSCRKMGIGREAVCLMMLYGVRHLSITRFFCKINQDNAASLSLFGSGGGGGNEKTKTTASSTSSSLGFVLCGYAECFGQYEYELKRATATELEAVVTALLGTAELRSFSCPLIETAAAEAAVITTTTER